MNTCRLSLPLFVVLVAVALSFGCNGSRRGIVTYKVSGTVTYNDQPVSNVNVAFIPVVEEGGERAAAVTNEKGYYQLSSMNSDPGAGAMPGEYRVTLSHKIQRPGVEPVRDASGNIIQYDFIEEFPAIYQDVENTPFTVKVVKGRNTFDFPVTPQK
ncbi:MAG TPA: hypothetical protein DEB39_10390 [Planctomycetaceae bacterium]|nr:hypothetical protein [Planctomycetaceae bacterium]